MRGYIRRTYRTRLDPSLIRSVIKFRTVSGVRAYCIPFVLCTVVERSPILAMLGMFRILPSQPVAQCYTAETKPLSSLMTIVEKCLRDAIKVTIKIVSFYAIV